ncbi:MAG: hypothetical protein Q9160_005245 [Pyrenula sp. 1 TL-2023]
MVSLWDKHRKETNNTRQFKTPTERNQERLKKKRIDLIRQIKETKEAKKAKMEKGADKIQKDCTSDSKPDAPRTGQKRARLAHKDDEHEEANSVEPVAKKPKKDVVQKPGPKKPSPSREDRRSAVTARRRTENPKAVARVIKKPSSRRSSADNEDDEDSDDDDDEDDRRFKQCLNDIGAVSEESLDEDSFLSTVPLPKKRGVRQNKTRPTTTEAPAKHQADASRTEQSTDRVGRSPTVKSTSVVESHTVSNTSTTADDELMKHSSMSGAKKRKSDDLDPERDIAQNASVVPKKLKVLDESKVRRFEPSARRDDSATSAPIQKPKLMPRSQNSVSSNPGYKGTAGHNSARDRRNNDSSATPGRYNATGLPKPTLPWSKADRMRELPKSEEQGSRSPKRKTNDSSVGDKNTTKQTRTQAR